MAAAELGLLIVFIVVALTALGLSVWALIEARDEKDIEQTTSTVTTETAETSTGTLVLFDDERVKTATTARMINDGTLELLGNDSAVILNPPLSGRFARPADTDIKGDGIALFVDPDSKALSISTSTGALSTVLGILASTTLQPGSVLTVGSSSPSDGLLQLSQGELILPSTAGTDGQFLVARPNGETEWVTVPDELVDPVVFVDTNGDDNTAEINNQSLPARTVQGAIDLLKSTGQNKGWRGTPTVALLTTLVNVITPEKWKIDLIGTLATSLTIKPAESDPFDINETVTVSQVGTTNMPYEEYTLSLSSPTRTFFRALGTKNAFPMQVVTFTGGAGSVLRASRRTLGTSLPFDIEILTHNIAIVLSSLDVEFVDNDFSVTIENFDFQDSPLALGSDTSSSTFNSKSNLTFVGCRFSDPTSVHTINIPATFVRCLFAPQFAGTNLLQVEAPTDMSFSIVAGGTLEISGRNFPGDFKFESSWFSAINAGFATFSSADCLFNPTGNQASDICLTLHDGTKFSAFGGCGLESLATDRGAIVVMNASEAEFNDVSIASVRDDVHIFELTKLSKLRVRMQPVGSSDQATAAMGTFVNLQDVSEAEISGLQLNTFQGNSVVGNVMHPLAVDPIPTVVENANTANAALSSRLVYTN